MDKGKIDHPFCAGRESVYTSELERLSSDPALIAGLVWFVSVTVGLPARKWVQTGTSGLNHAT